MVDLKFKNFVKLQRGFDLPKANRIKGKYPIVSSTSVKDYHNSYKVNGPGVVTGRSGSLGFTQFIKNKFWPLNTTLWVKDFKGNLPRYVYYLLKTLQLEKYNSGAGVPTLNRNHLDELEIDIHTFDEQVKISSILANYEELILNNYNFIQVLENIAYNFYKEYFVSRNLPDSKYYKKGFKFEKLPLEKVCNLISRGPGLNYKKQSIIPVLNQKCIRNGEINLSNLRYAEELTAKNNHLYLKINDILINSMGVGTLGRVSRNLSISEKMIVHNCITIIRPNLEILSSEYVYYFIKELEDYFIKISKGTTGQTSLDIKFIKKLIITLPLKDTHQKFKEVTSPVWNLIGVLKNKNKVLEELRNLLFNQIFYRNMPLKNLNIKISGNQNDSI